MARSPLTSSDDVVAYLTDQHDAIAALFTETASARDDAAQQRAFTRLRRLLAVHEAAEAMMVHPRVWRKIDGGAEVADARVAEERELTAELAELERIPCGTPDFTDGLARLEATVREHAKREEVEEFTLLAEQFDADELVALTAAVLVAERITLSDPDDVVVAPFASRWGRARHLLRGRR